MLGWATCLGLYCAVTILKFLKISEKGALSFPVTLKSAYYIADAVTRPQILPSFILGSPRVIVPPVCCFCGFCLSMRAQMAVGRMLLLASPDISFLPSGCLRLLVCWPGMERMTPCICHLYSKAESQKIAHQSSAFGFIIPFVTLGEAGQWCGLGQNSSVMLVAALLPFIISYTPFPYLFLVPFVYDFYFLLPPFFIVASSCLLS